MTVEGAAKVVEFAQHGLPIVFSGGIPTSYLGTSPPGAIEKAQTSIERIASLPNVHVTGAGNGLANMLESIGIHPATKFATTSPGWYTLLRSDTASSTDYYYIYNDAPYERVGEGSSSATIRFSSSGYPYKFDLSTGEVTPIFVYEQGQGSTTISMNLAGNQSTVIAFLRQPMAEFKRTPHLTSVSSNIIGHGVVKNGDGFLKATEGHASYVTAKGANRTVQVPKASTITLQNWTLIVEHWNPPANLYDIEGGAATHNTTHHLTNLVTWQQIPGLQNVSGRAFYSTSFVWHPSGAGSFKRSQGGAIIDFGYVLHTISVQINGHTLPPLDVTAPNVDITEWLVEGVNSVVTEVATPLGNVLQPIWDSLKTSGTGTAGTARPITQDYGLTKDVLIRSYWVVPIES